ncbi:IS5 family transposase [Candidatus Poribacteria bacterium]|nr:IS5 family transposase [Candidatus Poribacteria bacterium]
MALRLLLTDEIFDRLEPILLEIKPKVGAPPEQSDRMFIEAVLYVARTGIPWRDLPDELGNYSAVYNRLKRWKTNGTWERLWLELQTDEIALADNLYIDSTCIRAHQHAAGASTEKGGQLKQALGRSRGGFSTKIHVGCINEKAAISITLTPGQASDAKEFDTVFLKLPEGFSPERGIMDKAYDSNAIRQTLRESEIVPVIPPRKNRTTSINYDEDHYKQRNRVERFIGRIKQFRRIATRYEKLSEMFLAFIHLVSVYVFLS